MGLFDDTFKPVDVSRSRGVLGEEEDLVGDAVDSLDIARPAPVAVPTPPQEEQETVDNFSNFRPVSPEEETVDNFSNFRPVAPPESTQDLDSEMGSLFLGDTVGSAMASMRENDAVRQTDELAAETLAAEERAAYVDQMLPEGVGPGSYSPEDFYTDDGLYNAILPYMKDRIGSVQVDEMERGDVIESFFNSRRGVAMAGNSVRVLNEMDYLGDLDGDAEKLENAGRAYVMYENMAGITSDEYSWGELGSSSWDVLRGVVLDPVTYLTLGLGKVAAGVTVKTGTRVLETTLANRVQSQLAQGVAAETVERNAQVLVRQAIQSTATRQADDLTVFAARNAQTITQRFQTRAAWAEIGTTVAADMVAGSGVELLYQDQLVQTGVQDEVNRNSVALVAIASFGMGTLSAVGVASRGFSGTALPSQTVTGGSGKDAANALRTSIGSYFEDLVQEVDSTTSWASKVDSGAELSVQDTDFFIDLLLGVSSKNDAGEETVHLSGLVQVMQEQGFYFTKQTEDSTISNHVADFITSELDAEDVAGIITSFESASGTKLTGFVDEAGEVITGTPTPAQFANAFASKINSQARGLNSVSQAASRLGIDLADMDVEKFLEVATNQRLIGQTRGDALGERLSNTVTQTIAANQNRYIRTLVSHLSTSKLNVLGWGISSGMGSATDLMRATGHLGLGAVQSLAGMSAEGATNRQVSRALMGANANRINLLLDPDTTAAAFTSALERNAGGLERMNRTLTGGIDESLRTVSDMTGTTALGRGVDNYIDAAQAATMVRAQDTFTKSQEYVFQMDKGLRLLTGQSWNDFYTSPDAGRIMATRQYRELEESVVGRVMQHTFSESFKGRSVLGEIAGVIEDARNLPGVGMMVPFGRFFNNTVAFTARNSPIPGVANILKATGKFENSTHGELLANSFVAGGLVLSYASLAQDQRRQGLGMYEVIDESTGEVRSREYDYPLSLFIATGHALSYKLDGQPIPPEVTERLVTDFGITGLTRGLSTTADATAEAVKHLLAGEFEEGFQGAGEAGGAIVSQYVAGMTRPLEGLDTLIGVSAGIDMRPQNVKDGNLLVGRALSYVDNTYQLFTGEPFNDPRVSAVAGEADVDTGKQVGTRTVRLTNALRLMNMMDYETWDENASYRAMQMAAEAGNEYNRMFFETIEEVATQAMNDDVFIQMPVADQRTLWADTVGSLREQARMRLSYEYDGAQSTFADQLQLTDKYTRNVLQSTMQELELGPTLGDLTDVDIENLKTYLDNVDTIENYRIGGQRAWGQ
jgi:hypothetical protein